MKPVTLQQVEMDPRGVDSLAFFASTQRWTRHNLNAATVGLLTEAFQTPGKLKTFIAEMANKNALLADVVYDLAYYVQRAYAWGKSAAAAVFKLKPEEIYAHRALSSGGHIQTAVTSVCNAKCIFCAYPRALQIGKLKPGFMPLEIFKQVVDEWSGLGGEDLDLTPVVGDTLADPGLLNKIEHAVRVAKIKHVVLTTNGILLNRNGMYARLIDSGLKGIFISTQGTDRKLYREVYGVDHYPEVIAGLRNLLEYNRTKGNPVHISIRFRNAQKPSEILRSADFVEHIKPYLCRSVECNFTVDYDNWGGAIQKHHLLGLLRLRQPAPKVNLPCSGLFNYVVRFDGQVRLCGCRFKSSDDDDMIVGTIAEQNLEQISKGALTWKIIQGFYRGKRPETCRDCTLYRPVTRSWLRQRVLRTLKMAKTRDADVRWGRSAPTVRLPSATGATI